MDTKKTQKFRQRLLEEYQKLIRSINRNRLAEEEIKLENTEDEGDLATISHNKELLYNLHESDFQRLKSIQEALKRMDRGEYGECVRCGEDINEKRLMAVPWATLCIQCQEEAEREGTAQRPVLAGMLRTKKTKRKPEREFWDRLRFLTKKSESVPESPQISASVLRTKNSPIPAKTTNAISHLFLDSLPASSRLRRRRELTL